MKHFINAGCTRVTLDNTYCPSPICVPSRMSMLSGRYPHENAVWTNAHMLDSGIPTFAHAMGAGGYRPVLVGRMHAVGPDQLHGYAERLVGDHGANRTGRHGTGGAGPTRSSLEESGHGQSAYQVHDEDVTAATVHYLDRLGVQKRAGQPAEPFSLSVGFMLPHQPFIARKEDYERYYDSISPPQNPEPFGDHLRHINAGGKCGIVEVMTEVKQPPPAGRWSAHGRADWGDSPALRENDLKTIVVSTPQITGAGGGTGWWAQTFYGLVKVPAI